MRMKKIGNNLEVTLYLKKINKKIRYIARDEKEAFQIAGELLK
ncbi:MAG: hypothetical protein ACRCTS_08075 [Fusobacteriaceae bacterium]